MTVFDSEYQNIVKKIYNEGFEEYNERTKLNTKIITGAHFSFRVENFPVLTLQKIPLKLFIAEQIWYLQGEKELSFFQQYSKIWDDFKEEDNTVAAGYGYRWRKFFARDQMDGLINMFKKEPSSRQGVVVIWDPSSDGLDSPKIKNVPCVPMFIANIVNNELNFHVVFRSSDVMLGFPHDVAGFALLQHILAQHLGRKVGWLHYTASHIHIYENHYVQAAELISRNHEHVELALDLPDDTYNRAISKDNNLVDEIVAQLSNQYKPLSSLGKMKIAI